MRNLLYAMLFVVLSCSLNNSDEHNKRNSYTTETQFTLESSWINVYRGPLVNGDVLGLSIIGFSKLSLSTGKVIDMNVQWQNYNDSSFSYFQPQMEVTDAFYRNDSLFATAHHFTDTYRYYLYYVNMNINTAVLHHSGNINHQRIKYYSVVNGIEIAISEYGDAYHYNETSKSWEYVNGFTGFCYLQSVAKSNEKSIVAYTCGNELRKIEIKDSIHGYVVNIDDFKESSLVYSDNNGNVRYILNNELYDLTNDSLVFNKVLNDSLSNICHSALTVEKYIHIGQSTVIFNDKQLIYDDGDVVEILTNDALNDGCYNFENRAYYFDEKLFVLNVGSSTIDLIKFQTK